MQSALQPGLKMRATAEMKNARVTARCRSRQSVRSSQVSPSPTAPQYSSRKRDRRGAPSHVQALEIVAHRMERVRPRLELDHVAHQIAPDALEAAAVEMLGERGVVGIGPGARLECFGALRFGRGIGRCSMICWANSSKPTRPLVSALRCSSRRRLSGFGDIACLASGSAGARREVDDVVVVVASWPASVGEVAAEAVGQRMKTSLPAACHRSAQACAAARPA